MLVYLVSPSRGVHRTASHHMVVVVITRFDYRARTERTNCSPADVMVLLERSGFPFIYARIIHPLLFHKRGASFS